MGSRDKMQRAISIELLFDILVMDEVIEGKCEGKRNWPGLPAHVHLGVACVLVVPIEEAVCGWSSHDHASRDGAVRHVLLMRTPEKLL